VKLDLSVNGRAWSGEVEPRLTLADLLRDRLRLTGTHLGCEHGVCGACTVLVDGEAARSCLVLAVQADGHEVTTMEGLPPDLGEAFDRHRAFQCGFCTSGFLASAEAIRRSGLKPGPEQLRDLLTGNICRCTGYAPIVEAILEVLSEGAARDSVSGRAESKEGVARGGAQLKLRDDEGPGPLTHESAAQAPKIRRDPPAGPR
jgi:2-furoyl-CoA dehydrogenase 2Fe-2S iron sulfur subunit